MSGPTPKGLALFGLLCAAPLVQSGETDWPTYNTSSWIRQGSVFLGGIEEGEILVPNAGFECKIGMALLNWYLVYSAHRDGKPLAFIERWLAELKGLYGFFPYQIRGGHAQLLGYEKARQWYFKKCGVDVPVWANEGGVGGPREAVIAPVMMRTFGYQNFTYFCDKDYGRDRTMGLLDIWDQPKAAYFAYNTTIRMLKNTQPKGRADFGEAVVAYAFQRGAESIYCLWTEWSIGKAVRLKGPVQPVRLVDIMGNEQTVKAQDGAVAITLKSTLPLFIVSPARLAYRR